MRSLELLFSLHSFMAPIVFDLYQHTDVSGSSSVLASFYLASLQNRILAFDQQRDLLSLNLTLKVHI